MNVKKEETGVVRLTRCALMTAVICVMGPLSLPIGPVPVSLTNLTLYLAVYLLGWKWAGVSCLLYLVIGAAGLPVFSGFSGGLGKLLGPTGGFLLGFLPMVLTAGLVTAKFPRNRVMQALGFAAGTALLYALGTAWFCYEAKATVGAALAACVYPFIGVDLVKIAVAMVFGPLLRGRLAKAGLLARP